MFCPNCGTQNPDTAQTCSKCNFHLKGAAAPKFKGTMLMMNQPVVPNAAPAPAGAPPPAGPAPRRRRSSATGRRRGRRARRRARRDGEQAEGHDGGGRADGGGVDGQPARAGGCAARAEPRSGAAGHAPSRAPRSRRPFRSRGSIRSGARSQRTRRRSVAPLGRRSPGRPSRRFTLRCAACRGAAWRRPPGSLRRPRVPLTALRPGMEPPPGRRQAPYGAPPPNAFGGGPPPYGAPPQGYGAPPQQDYGAPRRRTTVRRAQNFGAPQGYGQQPPPPQPGFGPPPGYQRRRAPGLRSAARLRAGRAAQGGPQTIAPYGTPSPAARARSSGRFRRRGRPGSDASKRADDAPLALRRDRRRAAFVFTILSIADHAAWRASSPLFRACAPSGARGGSST